MLDDITLYWVTDTAASSARLYYESFAKDFARMALELPAAVSIFIGDFFTPPKAWGDQTVTQLDRGRDAIDLVAAAVEHLGS